MTDNVCFWIAAILYYIGSIWLGYIAGYNHGFRKCKKIDDEIIEKKLNGVKHDDTTI